MHGSFINILKFSHFKISSKADEVLSWEMLGAPSLSILGHSAVVYVDQLTFEVYIKLSPSFNSFANKILG